MKTGTLKELKVHDGDVVETKLCLLRDIKFHMGELWLCRQGESPFCPVSSSTETYTLVSRATSERPYGHVTLSDGSTVDLTANSVPCVLMGPDELQAMKDHGGPYELCGRKGWYPSENPPWVFNGIYRVAPKPVVETVVTYWNADWGYCSADKVGATQKITLTIHDGDIIDAKPEKLQTKSAPGE